MKLKTAIKKLRKGEIQIHYDNGDLKGLNKVLLGAFPDDVKAQGDSTYYYESCKEWDTCTTSTNRPTVKLSDIDFSKKKKKDKLSKAFNLLKKNNILMFKKTEQGAMYRMKRIVPDKTYGHIVEFYDKLDLNLNNRVEKLEEEQYNTKCTLDIVLKNLAHHGLDVVDTTEVNPSNLIKRVDNLETILKDHLRLDHNKVDTGWTDGGRLTVANLEDKPKPLDAPLDGSEAVLTTSGKPTTLKPEELVKGKWYVDNEGDFGKHSCIDDVEWGTTEQYYKGEYDDSDDSWFANPIREASQEELDSFLPDGHPDRSNSKTSDFNTNIKHRKKGDVCLVKNSDWGYWGVRFYIGEGMFSEYTTGVGTTFDKHEFTGVNR